ncbi:hypothetical protein BD626DRAFT_176245 [Schizophyllum amplum]|uniref:Uncharacterized protein n=1 Tax=Schizophyllum amplum TaxID=97359 RepID=A0A550BRG0_9AGAR|nr:hypothetical protein BD626DRAFT_176245 [Auriculariopsis ampla]
MFVLFNGLGHPTAASITYRQPPSSSRRLKSPRLPRYPRRSACVSLPSPSQRPGSFRRTRAQMAVDEREVFPNGSTLFSPPRALFLSTPVPSPPLFFASPLSFTSPSLLSHLPRLWQHLGANEYGMRCARSLCLVPVFVSPTCAALAMGSPCTSNGSRDVALQPRREL